MIINGGSRSNWRFFAGHLMKGEENERVTIPEIRGLAAETVLEALREMSALASGTRCKNFFYHANLNPRADERLSADQWETAVDTLEANLGLTGHSRFIVEHEKEGRCHRHVIWSRINPDTMTATSDSNNYASHERTARALEQEFGHASVAGAHEREGPRPKRRPKNWETFRGHASGIDPQEVTRAITALWQQADSGKAFTASLAQHGYVLCRGDRRDFCIVDPMGEAHSLARRIDGAKAAQIRARLADIDRASLPTVAEAKPLAKQLAADRQASAAKEQGRGAAPSTLDAFSHQVGAVMHSHGGELQHGDGLSWIERSVTVLTTGRDHVASWVLEHWENFVESFWGGRDSERDDPDIER